MTNARYNSQLGQTIESLTSETYILLQLLTDWSRGDATKPQVYDGYVNVAMAFVACSYAFQEHGIDMSTTRVAPQQIFNKLEQMLSVETIPCAREAYLPSIQSSVQLLLQDLRAKRRESYQLSRSRKRDSLVSGTTSTASTFVDMERAKTLQCLNGQGLYRDSRVQRPELVMFPRRSNSGDSATTKASETSSSTTLDDFTCGTGEKYVCGPCGTVCIEPIQDAVDSLTCTSLELKGLLEKWRLDPALAVNLYLSCMRVSQDYDAAVEVFGNKGAFIDDLRPVVQELKTAVTRATHFPYRCGHDELRNQLLFEACNSIERLSRGLRSRQRKYMLKHAPAVQPSVTHLLSCLKSLGEILAGWSHRRLRRDSVERACGMLNGAFKVVVSAFYAHGVDVSDLGHCPLDELSCALQGILTDEPSPENWQRHRFTFGAAVKNLLGAVLKKNPDYQLVVEIWWTAIFPDAQGELNTVYGGMTARGFSSEADSPLSTLGTQTQLFPQSSSLAPTQGHNVKRSGAWILVSGSLPGHNMRRITSSSLSVLSTASRAEPAIDLLADPTPLGQYHSPQEARGSIAKVFRRPPVSLQPPPHSLTLTQIYYKMRESISVPSPETADPLDPPLGITHLRQLREPPPYQEPSPVVLDLPLYTECGDVYEPSIPLVWPSVGRHEPIVNVNITRFLFAVQALCDALDLLAPTGDGRQEVRDTFAKMVHEWIRVQASLVECCAQDTRDLEEGMLKIHRIVSRAMSVDRCSRFTQREAIPLFQDTMRNEVVNVLRAKTHLDDY
ncbi:actin-interacting protein 3 [Ceratobasidium sp. AG-Ba]|nr:actin-interacting protein 3 [Ceratobasidium sp. AG-Ba]QRW03027.1 actin-interacting protein 3 [Ceratobasidium sp. AG-Ba]